MTMVWGITVALNALVAVGAIIEHGLDSTEVTLRLAVLIGSLAMLRVEIIEMRRR